MGFDSSIQQALREELDGLRRQKAERDAWNTWAVERINHIKALLESPPEFPGTNGKSTTRESKAEQIASVGGKRSLKDSILGVMQGAKHGMRVRDIAQAVAESGFTVTGTTPLHTLVQNEISRLSKAGVVRKTGYGKYLPVRGRKKE